MRRFTQFVTVGLLAALAQLVAAQAHLDPVSYNNAIVAEQVDLLKKNLCYVSKAAQADSAIKMEAWQLDMVKQNKACLAKLTELKDCDGDVTFRNEVIAALHEQLKVYAGDCKRVNLLGVTRALSLKNMTQYFGAMEAAEARLQALGDTVQMAQTRFARRHKMAISYNRELALLNGRFRYVSGAKAYQHQMFLVKFRIEKAGARVSNALRGQNVAGLGPARQHLLEETQAAMGAITPFQGRYTEYASTTIDLAVFYVSMALRQFTKMERLMARKTHLTEAEATEIRGYIGFYNTNRRRLSKACDRAANDFQVMYIPVDND